MSGDLRDHIAALCAGDDSGHDQIEEAARARPEDLRPFHAAMIEADVVMWPWVPLWLSATEETASRIVALVDAGHPASARWLLALGSGRTRAAAEAMRRWAAEPPPVAKQLGVPIGDYAREGGWEPDAGATAGIRELASLAACELVPAGTATPLAGSLPLGRACEWCGLELWRRLDVDLDDPALAELGLAGHGRVVAVTCLHCGGYARRSGFFGEYRPDGTTSWSAHNVRPDGLPPAGPHDYDEPTGRLALGGSRPHPVAGSAWNAGGSTLGGLPDWIQDAAYPACPSCGRTMYFLAMITAEDSWGDDLVEGCDYVFFCAAGCGITSVVFQQS